jgi:23S rRNA pseudouridine1911/1915/1917 synthase
LDKDTSGVVVVARDVITQHALCKQFSARTVGRAYYALVYVPPGRAAASIKHQGSIDGNIGRHPKQRKQMAVLKDGGKPARTHWRVVERLKSAVLLELSLETGRTHQIRVHMAHLGFPLIGDPLYGRTPGLPPDLKQAAQAFGRQALHAYKLAFDHPQNGKRLAFEVPLPPDFMRLLSAFRCKSS